MIVEDKSLGNGVKALTWYGVKVYAKENPGKGGNNMNNNVYLMLGQLSPLLHQELPGLNRFSILLGMLWGNIQLGHWRGHLAVDSKGSREPTEYCPATGYQEASGYRGANG